MALIGLFGNSKSAKSPLPAAPQDPHWVRSPRGRFHRLSMVDIGDPALHVGGVYVIWHAGVRPAWVYVGSAGNIADALDVAMEDEDITSFEINGGLYVAWSPILKDYRPGVLRYLATVMNPQVENPAVPGGKVEPIPVLLPGADRPAKPRPANAPAPEAKPMPRPASGGDA